MAEAAALSIQIKPRKNEKRPSDEDLVSLALTG
jgi:hypothetical protein